MSLATLGDRVLAGTIMDGLYYSDDNGVNWQVTHFGLQGNDPLDPVSNVAITETGLFAGDMRGVYRSLDSGTTWVPSDSGMKEPVMYMLGDGNNLIAAVGDPFSCEYMGNLIYRSTNGGKFWQLANPGLPITPAFGFAAVDTSLFVSMGGIYRSNDRGASWSNILTQNVGVLTAQDTTLFAASATTGVWVSNDQGNTWVRHNTGLPNSANITSFAVRDSMIFASSDTLGPSGRAGLVFLSTDLGNNWTNVSAGLDTEGFISMTVNTEYVFGGDQHRVWRRSLADILGLATVKAEPAQPESFPSLTQSGNRLTA